MLILFNIFFQRRKVHQFGEKTIVYGHDGVSSSRKTRPKTIWQITVAGDQQLINILQSKPDSSLLKSLTASSFLEVNVDIKCRQVKQICIRIWTYIYHFYKSLLSTVKLPNGDAGHITVLNFSQNKCKIIYIFVNVYSIQTFKKKNLRKTHF